jgi:mono/diheme cytochrome c family protein
LPKPRDLGSARFSDRALSEILWNGVQGSAMPNWHDLPLGELRGLLAFVQSLEERGADGPALTPEQQAQARKLFAANCQNCHGTEGSGQAVSLAGSLAPRATPFRSIRPSLPRAEQALAEGMPGTAMTAWGGRLSEAERGLLARFVRTLYNED